MCRRRERRRCRSREARRRRGREIDAPSPYGRRQLEAEWLESRAWRLDAVAVRLARARPAIDVALGEILLRLAVDDRLQELQYSCKEDFAREVLGMSRSTFFNIDALAQGLRTRPLLKKAMLAGEVTTVKALVIIKRTDESEDAPATLAAMEMTVAGLKKRFGKGKDDPEYTSVRWSMTPEQQDRRPAFGRCFAVLRSPASGGTQQGALFRGSEDPLRHRLRCAPSLATPTQDSWKTGLLRAWSGAGPFEAITPTGTPIFASLWPTNSCLVNIPRAALESPQPVLWERVRCSVAVWV